MSATISFLYVDHDKFLPLIAWLKYALDFESCMRIAPIPMHKASHSTTNSLLKSGNDRMGPVVIACFRLLKAMSAGSDHSKESFLSSFVRGPAIAPYH